MELKIPDPFLQKHLEEFQIAINDYSVGVDTPLAVYRGCVVKAAISCGWLEDVDVGEMLPAEVIELSSEIQETVREATNIPKN